MGYSVVNLDELEPSGPGDAVRYVRRALGVQAFGINWFEVPAGYAGPEHDERRSGQEEVNVVLRGGGHFLVDGGVEIPVRAGTVLRFDPETTRQVVAGPDGLTMLAVGARRGSYEPRGNF